MPPATLCSVISLAVVFMGTVYFYTQKCLPQHAMVMAYECPPALQLQTFHMKYKPQEVMGFILQQNVTMVLSSWCRSQD